MNKPLPITFLLFMLALAGNAQKLANVQKESLRVPQEVSIDGKLTEWGNRLQAHNNETEFIVYHKLTMITTCI